MDISIIIVTYNVGNIIKQCLTSLRKQSYRDFETIIIDNGSCDKTVDVIEEILPYLPQSKLVRNEKNVGTCQARNQAIKVSHGKYIMTLDSDVVLDRNFLNTAIKCISQQDKKVGIIGVKIMQLNNKDVIDSTGLILSKSLRFYDRGRDEIDRGQYDKKIDIYGTCAAAAIYRREMLDDIKENKEYFDPRFFYLVEDFDVALRAGLKGWKTVYCPYAICYHKRNGSARSKKIRQYLTFRNRYYFLLKNEHFKNIDKNIFLTIAYDTIRLFYMFFTNPYTLKAIKEITEFYIRKRYINLTC